MTRRVDLSPALAARIAAAAQAARPRECCGLLEGVRDGSLLRVLAVHPARNTASGLDRFEIDPADQFAARRAARANAHVILGCYHSHPGGYAQPSAADLAGAGEEDFLWLIAAEGALNAFIYSDGMMTGAEFVTSSQ